MAAKEQKHNGLQRRGRTKSCRPCYTQQDPIGLAGGLNLYGFANGDPVNFSDPFGLCPPADLNLLDCDPGVITAILTTIGGVGGGIAGAISGAGGCLATVVGTIPCAFAGAAAGSATGARVGLFVGSAFDTGVQLARVADDASAGAGGGNIIFSGRKVTNSVARQFGVGRRELGSAIERIKRAAGLRGNQNIKVDRSGNVFDKVSDENIGNIFDEIGR